MFPVPSRVALLAVLLLLRGPAAVKLRMLRRERWPVVIPLYDGRQCPYCGGLVLGKHGQRIHDEWHEQLEQDMHGEPVPEDPGGYVVAPGTGAYPELMRGARYGEKDAEP